MLIIISDFHSSLNCRIIESETLLDAFSDAFHLISKNKPYSCIHNSVVFSDLGHYVSSVPKTSDVHVDEKQRDYDDSSIPATVSLTFIPPMSSSSQLIIINDVLRENGKT